MKCTDDRFPVVGFDHREPARFFIGPPPPTIIRRCALHGDYRTALSTPAPCWTCEAEERRRRASRRQPPRRPYQGVADHCDLCGLTPLPPRRQNWCSDECGRLWMALTDGPMMRGILVAETGWFCWSCGEPATSLEVDHVRPLWSLTEEMRAELRWWMPSNLQLLCSTCHKAKTAHEAGVRARVRRGGVWSPWPGPQPEPATLFGI